MWNNDDDDDDNDNEVNEEGQPVTLYLPVHTGTPRKTGTAAKESHIGGHCFFDDVSPTCDHCRLAMYLLVQLKLTADGTSSSSSAAAGASSSLLYDRYLCLFVCPPQTDCFKQLKYDKGFSSGGQGVVKCVQRYVPVVSETLQQQPVAPPKSPWYVDETDKDSSKIDDNDYWGMDDSDINTNNDTADDGGLVTLENAVAAMEGTLDDEGAFIAPTSKQPKGNSTTKKTTTTDKNNTNAAFDCYLLKVQNEPPPSRPIIEEDDVGLTETDEKIRNMLARYMAEEDDEDILAALHGTNALGGGGAGAATEEDERLSDEDRILLGFQDRLRRVPRQVVRYAPGGRPLWSIPEKDRKSKGNLWTVPVCPNSGEDRRFMFQVLPSILEVLDVDKHSASAGTTTTTSTSESGGGEGVRNAQPVALDYLMSNGMNFGSIAVFCSPTPSGTADEMDTFVVVQESVDGVPVKGRLNGVGTVVNDDDDVLDFPVATMAVMEDLDDDADFEPDA